jgi:protein ImuA
MLNAGRDLVLRRLREQIARVHFGRRTCDVLPFGAYAVDAHLPGGGLALGALHEASGAGVAAEHAAVPTLFVAGCVARLEGPVLWCLRRRDLFAPGLACVGLNPDRIIFVETWKDREVLPAMEEGLRHRGLAAVVGEVAGLGLTASRRLRLAAAESGVTGFVIRRARTDSERASTLQANACTTRWRIAPAPAPPLRAPGFGPARWRVELVRCRGAEPASWIMEACDAQGRLAVPADLADRPHPQEVGRLAVAG